MNIKCNKAMRDILNREQISNLEDLHVSLPDELKRILFEGLDSIGDGRFLKSQIENLKNVSVEDFQDMTGLECFVNKINIDDYTNKDLESGELLRVLITTANLLKSSLLNCRDRYKVICNMQVDDFLTASLRFHKQRKGETWLNEDLDSYEEPIVEFTVN